MRLIAVHPFKPSFHMALQRRGLGRRTLLLVFSCVCCAETAIAIPVVWTGLNTTFSKVGTDDPALPASQDRLTDNVWLTRGSTEGIFNIAPGHEIGYTRFTSPADTQWATDVMASNVGKVITATNWQDLSFTDWAPAYGGPGSRLGSNITTHNAVVHLVTDDIYLNLAFSQFDSGGDFAYQRSTPAGPSLSGDYNNNGVVDAADYVVWRTNQGTTNVLPNDPIGGMIGTAQYNQWRAHFGQTAGSGASASVNATVPEPGTLVPMVFAAVGWRLRRRRLA